jgi:hypothetical protein
VFGAFDADMYSIVKIAMTSSASRHQRLPIFIGNIQHGCISMLSS